MSQWPTTRAELERTLIAAELRCGRCGYNLRGLSPLGVCPECGHEIWSTVLRTVDPAASSLPRLSNPRVVGWSILWIMLCSTLAAVLLVFAPARDRLGRPLSGLLGAPADALAVGATCAAALAVLGVFMLSPPRDKERNPAIMARLWLLGLGLLMWASASYWWSFVVASPVSPMVAMLPRLAMPASWIVALVGLDGILTVIGQRSRAYRTARGSKQSARAMIAASCAVALGTLVQCAARAGWILPPRMEVYGTMLVWTSVLMLLIGLAYMLINTLWIFHSLRRPPPALSALLLKVDDHGRARGSARGAGRNS